MKKKKILIQIIIISLLLAGIGIAFNGSFWEVLAEVFHLSHTKLLFLILFSVCFSMIEGDITRRMAVWLHPSFSIGDGIASAFYTSFFRLASFGTATAPSEIWYLHTKGLKMTDAAGIVTVKYTFQRAAVAIYGVISYGILVKYFPETTGSYVREIGTGIALGILVIALLLVVSTSPKAAGMISQALEKLDEKRIRKKGKPFPGREKRQEACRKVQRTQIMMASFFKERPGTAALLVLEEMLKMSCWYVIPYVVLQGACPLSFVQGMALMGTAYMLTGVIPAPGGFGAVEGMVYLMFEPVAGIKNAASATILFRSAISFLPFLLGTVVVLKNKIANRKPGTV